jgi:hypothetical protein
MCKIIAAYNKPLSERRIVRYAKDQIKDYNCFCGDLVYPYVTDAANIITRQYDGEVLL